MYSHPDALRRTYIKYRAELRNSAHGADRGGVLSSPTFTEILLALISPSRRIYSLPPLSTPPAPPPPKPATVEGCAEWEKKSLGQVRPRYSPRYQPRYSRDIAEIVILTRRGG